LKIQLDKILLGSASIKPSSASTTTNIKSTFVRLPSI